MELLSQPNIIIASRPNASLPVDIKDIHLELETIGFYPDQVKAYLEADPEIKQHANEVQSFLQDHWLMQGLMWIPIQLDALCYTWEDFDSNNAPDTMTCIYQAIELKLWRKDTMQLGRMSTSDAKSALPAEIVGGIVTERQLLECLAFNGLYNNIIEFTPTHRDNLIKRFSPQLKLPPQPLPLDDRLAKLSFLRPSDPSSGRKYRTYHFIHLTYQEYFAARYFVQKWKDHGQLENVFKRQQKIDPAKFLQRHKYSAHYDVFWHFVSGLLDSDDKRDTETPRFFQNIEEEPRDLLGPVHQWLVMHCLNELVPRESNFFQFQSKLEDQLSQWLLFECEFTKMPPQLTRERELSDQVLLRALAKASDKMKILIMESLIARSRPVIQESIIERASSWLNDGVSRSLKITILRMLGHQQVNWTARNLKITENVNAIAGRLEDEDSSVRWAAVQALQSCCNLSPENINTIAGRLEDEDWFVQKIAVQALRSRQNFGLETVDQYMESLYRTLMEKSFVQHLYWHVVDETTYILFDVQEVPFKGQQDILRDALQKCLKIPVTS